MDGIKGILDVMILQHNMAFSAIERYDWIVNWLALHLTPDQKITFEREFSLQFEEKEG